MNLDKATGNKAILMLFRLHILVLLTDAQEAKFANAKFVRHYTGRYPSFKQRIG